MKNRVTEILGIEKPVVQAPMAWITSPELVAAVSNAGGLGTLGFNGGFKEVLRTPEETKEEMRKQLKKTKELTSKPFAVDIAPPQDDPFGFSAGTLEVMKEENIKHVVLAGTDIDPNYIKQLKDDGFIIIARELNPTVKGAQALEKAGADIVVATGCDEGGCMPNTANGMLSITALLAENVKIPVLAAGGIVNDKFAKASAIVGAEGAFVGSRFILADECRSARNVKDDLINTPADDYIVFTQWEGLSKWRSTPHKVAKEGLKANEEGNLNPSPGSLYESMYKGNLEAGVNSANNVITLVKEVVPAGKIVDEIASGYED